MGKIYKGNIGVRIELDIGQDITDATITQIKYIKPDGTTGLWDASKGTGEDINKIYYITQEDDLDQAGVWIFYPNIELNDFAGLGETSEMTIYDVKQAVLTIGANTWIELDDANNYFFTRVGSGLWDESNTQKKAAALVSAYNQLTGCGKFSFPSEISQNMLNAQCEMALFLLKHQEDIDGRKGLQAQGVVSANIIGETYDKDMAGELPIPAMVSQLLKDYKTDTPIGSVQLERDDDES